MYYYQFRDFLLRHGLKWSFISSLMRTRISQAAASIPLIGYTILWSQKFQTYFHTRFDPNQTAWLNVDQRLYFLYFGAIFLTASWVVFILRCPKEVRRHPMHEDFLKEISIIDSVEIFRHMIKGVKRYVKIMPANQLSDTKGYWVSNPPGTLVDTLLLQDAIKIATNSVNSNYFPKSALPLAYFQMLEGERFIALLLAAIFWIVGITLFALPSIDVFQQVVRHMLGI